MVCRRGRIEHKSWQDKFSGGVLRVTGMVPDKGSHSGVGYGK